jgi:large subunit ribosomal protein L4
MADTKINAPAYTAGGTEREQVSLPSETFDGTVNVPVMHRAVTAYLANQRQGTASTKTRGFVTGGNQKPWRQKGTGRARQGSRRAPNFVGGGAVFGPKPRSYAQYVPRQVRALARKSALNARAQENALVVIDNFEFDAPKTRRLLDLFDSLGFTGQKVLVLTDGAKQDVYLSARNIPWAHVIPYSDVSTYHVLWSDVVLVESSALGLKLEPVAERERAPRPKASRPAAKAATTEPKATVKKTTARKTGAKKTAATRKTAKPAAKRATAKKTGGASKAKPKGKRK